MGSRRNRRRSQESPESPRRLPRPRSRLHTPGRLWAGWQTRPPRRLGSPSGGHRWLHHLSLIHISEPTRLRRISYAVFCLKKKKQRKRTNRNNENTKNNKTNKDKKTNNKRK